MSGSFRIKLKLAPKPAAAEGVKKEEGQNGATSSSSSSQKAKATVNSSRGKSKESKSNRAKAEADESIGGKRKRAAYSSSPEAGAQSSSPRQERHSSSVRGDASSLVDSHSSDDDEEEEEDEDDDSEDDSDGEEEEEDSGAEEVDELEDSPPPDSSSQAGSPRSRKGRMGDKSTRIVMARSGRGGRVLAGAAAGAHRKKLGLGEEPGSPTGTSAQASSSKSGKKSVDDAGKKRSNLLDDLPKPIDEMTLAEIDALPPAKRRKGLKVRGISGPGRGWRKGLKMDQRPQYGTEAESSSKKLQAAPGTPSSFLGANSKQRTSSLVREALSGSTPLRSESPYSRSSPAVGGDETASDAGANAANVAALKKRMEQELAQQKKKQQQSTAAAISAAQAGEARAIKAIVKGAPTILPLNKVPGSFITITALDKTKKPARKWERRGREVMSLGGRSWSSATWITREERQFAPPPDPKAGASATASTNAGIAAAAATRTATPVGAGAASGTATPSGGAKSGGKSGTASVAAATATQSSPAASASVSPTQQKASILSTPSSKLAATTKNSAGEKLTPSKNAASHAGAASSPSNSADPARDWRGSSAAYTMANRGGRG